jgi:8-oxo-dGTP diphosphatase
MTTLRGAHTENFVRVGVAVLVRRGGRLLMGLRKGSHGAGTWSVPGGSLLPEESVTACAVRELREETGLDAPLVSAVPVGFTDRVYDAGTGQHFATLYVLVYPDGEPRVAEPDKCERWEWVERDDLRARFESFATFVRERGTLAVWGPR